MTSRLMASLHEVRSETAATRDTSSPVGAEIPDSGVSQAKILVQLMQESCAALATYTVAYDLPAPLEEMRQCFRTANSRLTNSWSET